ncbi:trigger factor [Methylothermus subterraneus]
MQISVETTSAIGRKMTVQIPEEEIQSEVATRLKSLAQRVKVAGFRPGKVPAHIVRQRFGKQVREEVIYDLIGSSFNAALKEHALRPAGEPKIIPQETQEGFAFEAQFEVYPEIELVSLDTLEIRKPVCQITEADLENMLERLREQKKTWRAVERGSATGDRITLTFEAFQGDQPIAEGKVEHFQIELGAGQMIPGFEEKLLGSKPGDHLEFELTFPEDYHAENLAGKTVRFEVDVEQVEEFELPQIDAEFVKGYGIESGDVEEFRREVLANMERQLKSALKEEIKTRVFAALSERHSIPVPEALLKQEIQRMLAPFAKALKQEPKLLNQLPLDGIKESARKRVSLSLLLAEIVKVNQFKPDPDRVRQAIEELAENYEEPEKVVRWYYAHPEQLAQIENLVLEDQVVDWILTQAKVTEEPVAFGELMNKQQRRTGA